MRLLILSFFILIIGCVGPRNIPLKNLIIPEYIQLELYWEWGGIRTKLRNLKANNEQDERIIKETFLRIKEEGNRYFDFCNDSPFLKEGAIAYLATTDSNFIDLDCIYFMNHKNHFNIDDMTRFWSYNLNRNVLISFEDSVYHLFYFGDSLAIIDGNFLYHKKIDDNKIQSIKELHSLNKPTWKFSKKIFEIAFSLDNPIYSISYQQNTEKDAIYSPLKLDPSLLPLESPGYKALREQEEAMNKE